MWHIETIKWETALLERHHVIPRHVSGNESLQETLYLYSTKYSLNTHAPDHSLSLSDAPQPVEALWWHRWSGMCDKQSGTDLRIGEKEERLGEDSSFIQCNSLASLSARQPRGYHWYQTLFLHHVCSHTHTDLPFWKARLEVILWRVLNFSKLEQGWGFSS